MEEIIRGYLEAVKIGRHQTHKNLTLLPLLSTYALDLDYLLLEEALTAGEVEVVEVSKEGSVPDLKVVNTSPGMAMNVIYEKDRPSIEEYLKQFHLIDSQVGAVFLIDGKVAGLDAFGKAETFSKVFKRLVESNALDAIDCYDPEKEHKALKSRVTEFLGAGLTANTETRPSVGTGTDYRLSSQKLTGFALCLDGKILHLSVFARQTGTGH